MEPKASELLGALPFLTTEDAELLAAYLGQAMAESSEVIDLEAFFREEQLIDSEKPSD